MLLLLLLLLLATLAFYSDVRPFAESANLSMRSSRRRKIIQIERIQQLIEARRD